MAAFVEIDLESLKAGLEQDTLVVVDVREAHEFASGHIPGSVSMPLSRFNPQDLPLHPHKRIVFSCAAGIRSMQALMLAAGAGVPIDTHYRGGFKGWVYSGEPVARLDP